MSVEVGNGENGRHVLAKLSIKSKNAKATLRRDPACTQGFEMNRKLRDELYTKTIDELRTIVQKLDVSGRSKLKTKESLVDRILECDERGVRRLLDAGVVVETNPARTSDSSVSEFPKRFGPYLILRELGKGGYGEVHQAIDRDDQIVAIKIPRKIWLDTTEEIDRFMDEAKTLRQLDHPRIVKVRDVGSVGEVYYIALQYIDGSNLAQLSGQRRLGHLEAASLVAEIAEVLHHAHTQGFIHRDIKPSNILVDKDRRPYLTDFGLAVRHADSPATSVSRAGTPRYMSPEQLRGSPIDVRTDIYSLGLVLYQLLCGQRPYASFTSKGSARSRLALFTTIQERELDRLSSIDASVPEALEKICLKALSEDKKDRYNSANDMARALRSAVKELSPARPPGNTSDRRGGGIGFLTANNGPQAGRRYALDRPESVLGRHPECDIVIDVGAVSRYHCKVVNDGLKCFVEDLNSRNGTFVNEQVIQGRTPLEDGTLVRVCDVVFTFHDREQPPSFSDDSSFRAVMVDDESSDSGGSTIISKLDVRSSINGPSLAASPEAKLDALIEITRSLSNSLSLDKVLPELLDSLFRIFVQADRGFVGMLDDDGVVVPRWTKLRRDDPDDTIRVSRTIANQVMETKSAVLSADVANDARFYMSQSIADFRIRSMMYAPLVDRHNYAFGILQIDTLDQKQRFREDDLDVLVSAAAQASIAISNAKLHEESLRQQGIERDLQLAREVQQGFLPQAAPDLPDYTFYSYYRSANHIGGDYYDYVPLPNGNLAVIVADVVGHGVAAAMLMAKLSAESRYCLASEPEPAVAVTRLNHRLCQLNLNRFVTFVVVVIDPKTHNITIVNAGHMTPMYRRADGTVEEPGQSAVGIPLGIMDGAEYKQASITLQPGELLVLYTDGLDEATNSAGEQYSIERMRERVKAADGTPEGTGESLITDVRAHTTGCPQDDDMCLVVFRRD